jgi:hypothetical protein
MNTSLPIHNRRRTKLLQRVARVHARDVGAVAPSSIVVAKTVVAAVQRMAMVRPTRDLPSCARSRAHCRIKPSSLTRRALRSNLATAADQTERRCCRTTWRRRLRWSGSRSTHGPCVTPTDRNRCAPQPGSPSKTHTDQKHFPSGISEPRSGSSSSIPRAAAHPQHSTQARVRGTVNTCGAARSLRVTDTDADT